MFVAERLPGADCLDLGRICDLLKKFIFGQYVRGYVPVTERKESVQCQEDGIFDED
jgi:hypothetical protein